MVFKQSGDSADESLPKELEGVILFEVLLEAEDLEVAKEGFDVTGDLALLGIGFDDEVEPAAFKIELPIGEGEIIYFGDVEAEEPHAHVEGWLVGERVQGHFVIEFGLIHDQSFGLHGGDKRGGFIADIGEVVDGGLELREVNIDGLFGFITAEMG